MWGMLSSGGGGASSSVNPMPPVATTDASSSSFSSREAPRSSIRRFVGSAIPPEGPTPPLLQKLCRFLTSKGTRTPGLFGDNVEASHKEELEFVKKKINFDKDNSDISSFTQNPLVAAEVLRQYLFALPEPLLTFDLYDSFLITLTMVEREDRMACLQALTASLPLGYRKANKEVLTLFNAIHKAKATDGLDSAKLASIFGPVFLRPAQVIYYMADDVSRVGEVLQLLIEEAPIITTAHALTKAHSSSTSIKRHISTMQTIASRPRIRSASKAKRPQQPLQTPSSSKPPVTQSLVQLHQPLLGRRNPQMSEKDKQKSTT
ncbi:hypothetical protein QOT17_000232 [Balamuthia mandrillaris]